MGERDDVVARLERAALAFGEAGRTEQAVAIMRVAQALRALPDELADDLADDIIATMSRQ